MFYDVPSRRGHMFNEQKRKCWFCGKFCWYPRNERSARRDTMFTVEHIYPKSCGGQNTRYNLVGACYRCNQKRNSQFMQARRPKKMKALRLLERDRINSKRSVHFLDGKK